MADDTALTFFTDCSDASVAALHLVRAEGREALSEPYVYRLELDSHEDQGLSQESIDAWMNARCHIAFGAAQISGVIRDVTLLPSVSVGGEGVPRVSYEATLVPKLTRLEETERSRVFQEMTPMQVVEAVLTEHAVAFESGLVGEYPWREYVVQYDESDLAFVSRLMEHWGVYYFFEQRDDGEVLILADDNRAMKAHPDYASLRFQPDEDDAEGTAWIAGITRRHRRRTASLTLRDYNWRAPYLDDDGLMTARQLQLRPTHAVDEVTGSGEHWRYGDHFKDDAEGATLARIRAEELLVERVRVRAAVRAPGLAAGHRFETSGMPLAELEREYVVLELSTVLEPGATGVVAAQTFHGIAADVPFRPKRVTPRPVIHGFMHAVVDGEVLGVAAPIDSLGRYKVVMPYDQAAAPGGSASRWIRMAQPSAGPEYGMHLPLHIGTEIAVVHLGGDPDRPVIMGSVPNVDTVSPVVDANATQSRIRTSQGIIFELEDDASASS